MTLALPFIVILGTKTKESKGAARVPIVAAAATATAAVKGVVVVVVGTAIIVVALVVVGVIEEEVVVALKEVPMTMLSMMITPEAILTAILTAMITRREIIRTRWLKTRKIFIPT